AWVKGEKIGFIGIGLSNWITYHGISLNANVNLRYFSMIMPCGIKDITVTSMEKILHSRIDIDSLKRSVVESFCEVFSLERRYYNENASVAFAAASASGAR
ncbi:MAG: octanoyltransferase, partial [bacterium]|nr:octanoyltransferase [bacterium]